jgi:hypothetical protein
MKCYLIITGALFGIITVLHVWRATDEWPHQNGAGPMLAMIVLIVLPGVLSWWAWRLLRKLPGNGTKGGNEKEQGKGSDDLRQ